MLNVKSEIELIKSELNVLYGDFDRSYITIEDRMIRAERAVHLLVRLIELEEDVEVEEGLYGP